MAKSTLFGRYIRQKRNEAKLSLKNVADQLGITKVYLGEVERGVRGPLQKDRWSTLAEAIPGVTVQKLAECAELSKPVQLDLNDAEPNYRDLALALSRRIQDQSLSDREVEKLLTILRRSKGEKFSR